VNGARLEGEGGLSTVCRANVRNDMTAMDVLIFPYNLM